jgi:hypothetical protein
VSLGSSLLFSSENASQSQSRRGNVRRNAEISPPPFPLPLRAAPNPQSAPSGPPPPQVHFDFPISGGYRPEN